ncbi:MAG: lysylphosphatidylglycerol synthase transmembrane domain-containing protein [Polyangiaceae bacterium]
MSTSPSRVSKSTLLKAAVSLAIVALIISRIQLRTVGALLLTARPGVLALATSMIVLQLVVGANNSRILLNTQKRLPFARVFKYYCFGWTAGLVSVGKIGEFSITYYLKQEGLPYSKSLAIVLLDKVVTLAVYLSAAVCGTLWFFGFSNHLLLAFDAAILSGLAGVIWFFLRQDLPFASLLARIPKLNALLTARMSSLATFRETFAEFFHLHRAALIRNVLGTFLKLAVTSLNGSVLFIAINTHINPVYMMFVIAIAAIMALFPVSLSGLGVTDATFIYLASLVDIPAEAAVATELLSIAGAYVVASIIAIGWTLTKRTGASST